MKLTALMRWRGASGSKIIVLFVLIVDNGVGPQAQ